MILGFFFLVDFCGRPQKLHSPQSCACHAWQRILAFRLQWKEGSAWGLFPGCPDPSRAPLLSASAPLLPHLFGLGIKACFCRAFRAVVITWCKGCGSWRQSFFPEQVMCASSPEGSCWGLLWCLGWTSPLSLEWRGRWKVPFQWAHRRRRGSSSGQGPPKDRKSVRMSFLAEV